MIKVLNWLWFHTLGYEEHLQAVAELNEGNRRRLFRRLGKAGVFTGTRPPRRIFAVTDTGAGLPES